jgi:DNA-binding HxlR family transcriptional regulator
MAAWRSTAFEDAALEAPLGEDGEETLGVDLVNKLEAETPAGRQGRMADYLGRQDVVVLDEFGYLPFAQSGDRCACGLYSWRNRPYVCCMSTEPQQLPADCRRAGDILARLGDKWTILLLMVLGDRRMRFTELHRAVNGISERMLTVTLRNLEHEGILIRTVYLTIPPRVEYELSDRGRSLKLALAPIGRWVMEKQTDIEETRERLREQSPEDSAIVDD